MNRPIQRSLFNLARHDFEAYPIWEEVDDDDTVEPRDLRTDPMSLFDSIYYCRSEFQFPDGSYGRGYLRVSSGTITTVHIWMPSQTSESFSLLAPVRTSIGDTPQRFAACLGKELVQVFPMRYQCQIGAVRLEGVIDAATATGIPLPAVS